MSWNNSDSEEGPKPPTASVKLPNVGSLYTGKISREVKTPSMGNAMKRMLQGRNPFTNKKI